MNPAAKPSNPLLPANAGTQIPKLADWKGSALLASASRPFHLGPAIRRDERINNKENARPVSRGGRLCNHLALRP